MIPQSFCYICTWQNENVGQMCWLQEQWKLLVCCYICLVLPFVQSRQVLVACDSGFQLWEGPQHMNPLGWQPLHSVEYQPANDICKSRIHFLPWRTPDMCSPPQTHNTSTNSMHDEHEGLTAGITWAKLCVDWCTRRHSYTIHAGKHNLNSQHAPYLASLLLFWGLRFWTVHWKWPGQSFSSLGQGLSHLCSQKEFKFFIFQLQNSFPRCLNQC